LPLSWLSDEYMKKIKGDYKPAGSKPGREAPSDLVIRVVIDSDGKRPRNLEKLANLINSRRRQFELLGTTTLPEAR
jgi:hypothetical protein